MVPPAKSRSCHPHVDVVANVSTPIFIGSCPTGKKSMYRETKGERQIADQLPLSRRVKQKQEKSSDLLQTQQRQVKVISRRLVVPAALRTRNASTTSQPSSPLALTPLASPNTVIRCISFRAKDNSGGSQRAEDNPWFCGGSAAGVVPHTAVSVVSDGDNVRRMLAAKLRPRQGGTSFIRQMGNRRPDSANASRRSDPG
jgi:hypothetical protein